MAYIELDNVLYRGTLKAATGEAKFRLTASAINAVDTINIGNDQVTYNKHIIVNVGQVYKGQVIAALPVDIPDTNAWLEIIAYASRASAVTVDGQTQLNRNRRQPSTKLLPFITVIPLSKGAHTIRLIAGSSGSTSGYIVARYIRTTGT